MTVTSDALDMLAGDPVRERKPGDFHRHPTTGAPYVIVEKDGKRRKVMYGRPSSFGSALDNPYNLLKWKERQLAVGISRLSDWTPWLDPEDRDGLDALVAHAYDAAETSLAADRGTHIHLLLEWADLDEQWTDMFSAGERLGIPAELQQHIINQWLNFRERLGVTALAVEQTVVNDRWRLAGTLDRLDVTSEPILTAYGILDGAFVGDIKTGGLTLGNDGQPNYWVKYPVQLAAYVDAVPYDTDTDERAVWMSSDRGDGWLFPSSGDGEWSPARPNQTIALIYHYDLARALAGEVVDWQAIPVNVAAGREGGDLCRAAADFGKRRDLFAMPAPQVMTDEEREAFPCSLALPHAAHWWDVDSKGTPVQPHYCNGVPFPIAVPVSPVTVEQPAVDPRPDTASPPVAVSAAERNRLVTRIKDLCDAGHEHLLRGRWPTDVLTLKHRGHTPDQLEQILAAVRRVEAEIGAGWHPDDGIEPRSAKAIRRALEAWAGRDPGTAWFAASLIATFEQCRNADSTFEQLVASFSIEQCDRLYDAAQSTSHDWHSGENQ